MSFPDRLTQRSIDNYLLLATEDLDEAKRWRTNPPPLGVSRELVDLAIDLTIVGHHTRARECLRIALPWLERDIGPNAPRPANADFPPPPPTVERLEDEDGQFEMISSVASVDPGHGMFLDSVIGRIVAIQWLLGKSVDPTLLEKSFDLMRTEIEQQGERYGNHQERLDTLGIRGILAGRVAEAIDLFSGEKLFKPPIKPAAARTERAMAHVLLKHLSGDGWSRDQVEQAMQTFLKNRIVFWLEHGDYDALLRWTMYAFWIWQKRNPEPMNAFMSIYDYIPGVERPAIC